MIALLLNPHTARWAGAVLAISATGWYVGVAVLRAYRKGLLP